MELLLTRKNFTDTSTIGTLTIDGKDFGYILEDTDRKLEEGGQKIYGKTAIPRGRYQIIISYSNRFQQLMPLLLNVPQYAGVRIHPGNTSADTEGCLLPGLVQGHQFVSNSRLAYKAIMVQLRRASKIEKIFITIK